MMFLDGYIGAPPTMTVFSTAASGPVVRPPIRARLAAATATFTVRCLDMACDSALDMACSGAFDPDLDPRPCLVDVAAFDEPTGRSRRDPPTPHVRVTA